MEAENHEKYKKQLVSAARAVLAHEIALPLGCRRIAKILRWLGDDPFLKYPLFFEFTAACEARQLPLGSDRLYWDKEKLRERDIELHALVETFGTRLVGNCWDIVERLSTDAPHERSKVRFVR